MISLLGNTSLVKKGGFPDMRVKRNSFWRKDLSLYTSCEEMDILVSLYVLEIQVYANKPFCMDQHRYAELAS